MEVKYISKKDVAKMLSVSVSTINVYVKKGTLPSYKLEKRILFDKEEVIKWMEGKKEKKIIS